MCVVQLTRCADTTNTATTINAGTTVINTSTAAATTAFILSMTFKIDNNVWVSWRGYIRFFLVVLVACTKLRKSIISCMFLRLSVLKEQFGSH
jgi:hypothetical protein